jgi:hypothetical protein
MLLIEILCGEIGGDTDLSSAIAQPPHKRRSRSVHLRYLGQIEMQLQRVACECLATRVLKPTHVSSTQTPRDAHPGAIQRSRRSNSGHTVP